MVQHQIHQSHNRFYPLLKYAIYAGETKQYG